MSTDYRNREFETNTSYTRMKAYVQSVYPHHVRDHARMILDDVKPGYRRYRYAAELTRYVYQNVEYSAEDKLWRGDYILDHTRKGDCEDQSVLLASLLSCRSFDVRFAVVRRKGDESGHVMLQVLFDNADLNELVREAEKFYRSGINRLHHIKKDDGNYWLNCDPVHSSIAGRVPQNFVASVAKNGEITYKRDLLKDYLYPGETE